MFLIGFVLGLALTVLAAMVFRKANYKYSFVCQEDDCMFMVRCDDEWTVYRIRSDHEWDAHGYSEQV